MSWGRLLTAMVLKTKSGIQGSELSGSAMIRPMIMVADLKQLSLIPVYAVGNRHAHRLPGVSVRHKRL